MFRSHDSNGHVTEQRTKLSSTFFQKLQAWLSIDSPEINEIIEPVKLHGYTPLQTASYFALPVAPNIDFVAIDRMLKESRVGDDNLLDLRCVILPLTLAPIIRIDLMRDNLLDLRQQQYFQTSSCR